MTSKADIALMKLSTEELRDYVRRLGLDPAGADDKQALADLIELHAFVDVKSLEPTSILVDGSPPALCPDIPLEDISWRVDSKPTSNGRARFISYIDARVAAKTLDQWVGPDGWEATYTNGELAGQNVLWCHLTLHFPDRSVVRSDLSTYKKGRGGTAEEQASTGIKGLVSDAFKRAAAKAGVGRNAYALPEIWAPVRVDDKNRAWPNDQTMPAIQEELRRAGHQTSVRVDQKPADETDDGEPAADVNWFNEAKIRVYEYVDKDKDVAAQVFTAALRRLEIDSIDDEKTCDAVVAAAGTVAAELDLVAGWLNADQDPDDPAWVHTRTARKAVYGHADENLPSAVAIYEAMSEGMSEPLSRDDMTVLLQGLEDDGNDTGMRNE